MTPRRLAALLRHLPKSRYARVLAELGEVRAGLDALDRGVIEAGVTDARTQTRLSAVFATLNLIRQAQQGQFPQPLPRPGALPTGHPESLGRELSGADEELFAAYCADDLRGLRGITQDGPGAP